MIDDRGVEQLVARQAHNLEVACSSPASATNNDITSCKNNELCRFFVLWCDKANKIGYILWCMNKKRTVLRLSGAVLFFD